MAKIVVVDDDPELRRVVELTLESVGHEVRGTSNPFEAVDLVRRCAPDLAIFDVLMPGKTGLDILREMVASSDLARVPVVLLSALKDSRSQAEGLELGAVEYLAKPFIPDELLARVERLLEPSSEALGELAGNLRVLPLDSLFQSLERERFSGFLHLVLAAGEGTVCLCDGLVEAATWNGLSDQEAVLALLAHQDGHFELETLDFSGRRQAVPPWSALPLTLEAAWLADELGRRTRRLPALPHPLRRTGSPVPSLPDGFDSLPINDLLDRIDAEEGTPFARLRARLPVAPQKVDLAVAWLIERGVLESVVSPPVSTVRMEAFLAAAAAAGYPRPQARLLLVCAASEQGEVERLLECQGGLERDAGESRWALQFGPSYRLVSESGSLGLHHQVLSSESSLETDALLALCFGVAVWAAGLADGELERLGERMKKDRRRHRALLLLSPGGAAPPLDPELWRIQASRPQGLDELLSLLL